MTDEVDGYGLRRAWKRGGLTHLSTTPTTSSRFTLPCEPASLHDNDARAATRSQSLAHSSTHRDFANDELDEYGLRRACKLSGLTRSRSTPTPSSRFTLPHKGALLHDCDTRAVARLQDLANDSIRHEGVTDDVDEYGLRRACKLSGLTRSRSTPTPSSRFTLPHKCALPHDRDTRAVARLQDLACGLTGHDAVTDDVDEYGLRRAWKLGGLTRSCTTPTPSSRPTLPCTLTLPPDSEARAVARVHSSVRGSTRRETLYRALSEHDSHTRMREILTQWPRRALAITGCHTAERACTRTG